MSLLTLIISADTRIIETVAARRLALVPADFRAEGFAKLGGEEVILSYFQVDRRTSVDNLLSHLADIVADKTSGVILLSDGQLPSLAETLGDVFSVNTFVPPAFGRSVENVLAAKLSKVIKAYRYFRTRFDNLKYQQIIRLPLRNFDAPEIERMRSACRDMTARGNFAVEFDAILSDLRQRRQPKKASNRDSVYIVDDRGKHFALGKEVHAKADTTIPPHTTMCRLQNTFRFGRRFDGSKHFNVSLEQNRPMDGNYYDCHDAQRPGGGENHLNMFSNDFF